ncbi:hypothetical protein NBRC116188_14960 [Oceaniserpentilla sp. 4NH20-0058]|uniref:hypothetical protein n=1 Tax=Oceaniserpentilla sp. 4NH20-0058 TaxID=3127660 RepID=UPI0031091B77
MKKKYYIVMEAIILSILISISSSSNAVPDNFFFVFQSIYKSKVTSNKVNNYFGDFENIVNQPVTFSSNSDFDDIKSTIEHNKIDLLLWGYSKKIDKYLNIKGFHTVAISPITVNIYKYGNHPSADNNQLEIAVLKDSAAHYSAKKYFKDSQIPVKFIFFNNYFDLLKSCFKKEVDLVAAAPSFLIPQPDSVQALFKVHQKLPVFAKVAVWVKESNHKSKSELIFNYFESKELILSNIIGTEKFNRP